MHQTRLPHSSHTLFWFGLAAFLIAGFLFTKYPIYWERGLAIEGGIWLALCALVGYGLRWRAPQRAGGLFCLLLIAYLFVGAGVISGLSTVFFIVSAHSTGRIALNLLNNKRQRGPGGTESLMVGLALYLAFWGVLIHFPINIRWIYVALLSTPIIYAVCNDSTAITTIYKEEKRRFESWTQAVPLPVLILCVGLMAWVARFVFFPTIGYDENAIHLRMWTELLHQRKFTFDVSTHVSETVPFAVNLLHSIISLVAGEDARSALNLALMLLLLRQVGTLLENLSLSICDRLLLLVLLVSTPMLANILISLQAELFLAFLCTSGVWLLLNCDEGWWGRNVLAVVAVAAMCAATKLPGAVLGVFLLLAMTVRVGRFERKVTAPLTRRTTALLLISFSVMTFLAFHSYIVAYRITGNPVFPFYNAIFKSQFFPMENFADTRWIKGFSFSSYRDVFFKTSAFGESRNFTAGFQYLLLFPLSLIAVWRRSAPRTLLLLLLPLLGYGMVMFHATQYWRYMFPVAPLATVIMASLLFPVKHLSTYFIRGLIVGCVAVNLFFLPGIFWMFTRPLQPFYLQAGKDELTKLILDDKAITARISQESPGARVLYPDRPYGATLNGTPLYVNWYSPSRSRRFSSIKSSDDMASFIRDEKAQFVIWNLHDYSRPEEPNWWLREYLSRSAYPQYQIGEHVLYRISNHEVSYRNIFDLNGKAAQASKLPAVLSTVRSDGAAMARYNAVFKCTAAQGAFVAQLNWDVGDPYYRLVPCTNDWVDFSESFPIPIKATQAQLYLTVRDVTAADVSKLTVEVQ